MSEDGWNDDGWSDAAREYRAEHKHNGGNGRDESEIIRAEIVRLAKLGVAAYEIERAAAAKRLGMRTPILDKLVDAERREAGDDGKQGHALTLPEPKPWSDPVDGAVLLHDLAVTIRRYVVMPEHSADATALWAVHTYMLDALQISPRLAITSPEKGCGKTTLLDVLTPLLWRPLPIANTTASPIFRAIEIQRPALLIDEADTFLGENEELRGILNSGHRRGGSVLRTVGDDFEPRQFSTYSACSIALIGRLPGTLTDRSIAIELQRRLDSESIESFRSDRTAHLDELASKAARWAADNLEGLSMADPAMPPGVFNRVADNWRPLLAIADIAGGEWPQRARRALDAIRAVAEDDSIRVQLLTDINAAFAQRGADRLPSGDLVEALIAVEGRPWAEWKAGKPLSQNSLARLLKPLKIRPDGIRTGDRTPKGYYLAQFEDAFRRYLLQEGGFQPQHRNKADEMGTSSIFQPQQRNRVLRFEKCDKPNNDGLCCGVAVGEGDTTAAHRCDHCGGLGRAADPLSPWDWPGRPDGIWLHASCEEGFTKRPPDDPWADYPDIPASLDRRSERAPALGAVGDSLDDFK
jgi:putative DNA primase/helicase